MRTIVVLGMHRSGTSAITRALGLLGAEMGPADHLGKHWENRLLRNVSTRLLNAGGGSWDTPPLDPAWLATTRTKGLPEMARQRLDQELGRAEIVTWKDPRVCLTLPFWQPLIGENPVVVLIHRHPDEVARSLESRNRFGAGLSFALWERYNGDALRNSTGLPAVVVKYTDLVDRPQEVMTDLVGHLRGWDIDLPKDPATTDLELRPSERHHVSDTDDVLKHPVATESQRVLFDLLASLDGPHSDLQAQSEALPAPHPLSDELIGAAAKIHRVRKRARRIAGRSDQGGRRKKKEPAPST